MSISRYLWTGLVAVLIWVSYAALQVVPRAWAIRWAGTALLARGGRTLVQLAYGKRQTFFKRNLRLVLPALDEAAQERLMARQSQKILVNTVERCLTWRAKSPVRVVGLERLHQLGIAQAIFVTAHLGNRTLMLLNLRQHGFACHFLFRHFRVPWLDGFLRHFHGRFAVPVDTDHVADFVQAIRDGHSVLCLPDIRVKKGRNGVMLLFCGYPAWTSTFIADMAIHYQKPIVPVSCLQDQDGVWVQMYEEPIWPTMGSKQAVQQLINDALSRKILENPELWELWDTNRWGR